MPAAAPALVGLLLTAAEVNALWVLAGTLATSFAVSMLFGTDLEDGSLDDRGHQINTRSTSETLPLIYGKCRVGINQVYIGTSGSNNKYLHIVGVIGEGPINGIVSEYGVPQVFLNDKLYNTYGGLVTYEFFTGSSTQTVCSTLNTAVPEWTDPLRYTSYIYVCLEYDRDKFSSIPDIEVVVEGLKVYNPITDTTAYSNNAALCTYDLLTRSSVRGGMGVSSDRVYETALDSAIDYCTDKGWTCNIPITDNQPVSDNLQLILNNFRGDLIYSPSEDKFKILFRDLDYESPAMDLDEDDLLAIPIVGESEGMSRPNALKVSFLNETNKYQVDTVIIPASDAPAGEDYRESEVKLYGLSTHQKAQEMGNYFLERLRWNKFITIHVKNRCWTLEPMDLIQLSYDNYGWSDKLCRVISMSINSDFTVTLNLIEEGEFLYDSTYNLTQDQWYDTSLPNPNADVEGVAGISCSEETYYYRNRTFTRWKIDFDPPDISDYPWWDYAEVWIKIGAGDWKFMTKSTDSYVIDPVEEGEIYYCKVRSVSIFGQKEDFEDAATVSTTIVGKTTSPSDLSSMTAVANGDSVSIFADPISDPDVESYEVRLGSTWGGGIFISMNKAPSIRLVGVRPGEHTFFMSPLDNAGNYSDTPVSSTVEVFIPAGYTSDSTWSWDFSTGTHSNTAQQTTSPGSVSDPVLKCSHTSGVLTGTWTSPTYDLTSIKDVRLWGDFRTTFSSAGTTWGGVVPSPDTWADIDVTTKSWKEIFGTDDNAGQIQAVLKYKELSGDAWSEIEFFQILCAEVSARYIAVEVTIVDPLDTTNLYLYKLNMSAYTW